jgi:glyoxylase-like metal-dependent hydrolase (beta-lactamase superfamily II)
LRHEFFVPISPTRNLERFVYSVIIFGEKVTLIDSGVKNCHERIFHYLKENRRDSSDIDRLILSHSHPDHIGSANCIKAYSGCQVLAAREEKDWIEDIDLQNKIRPVPGFYGLVDESVTVDRCLGHRAQLDLGQDVTLEILHTPGHSRGSLSVLIQPDRVLFTADAVPLQNDIPNYDNFRELKKSLETLRRTGDYDILLSSWAEPAVGATAIGEFLAQGEGYLERLDTVVRRHYAATGADMGSCGKVIAELGLPKTFAIPLVHRAFLSHVDTAAADHGATH